MPLLNERPPKPAVTDQTAYAGVRFTYQVPEVTDADGDDLTYDAVQGAAYNPLPSWLTFDSTTRTFTGRQRTVHIDTYTIRVIVSDGQQSSWAEFSLTVAERPANLPPTAAALTAQTATEDLEFSYVLPEFTDPDGNTLSYTAGLSDGGSLPGWLSFNATNRTLSGTPLEADTPASHTIRITATDDATPPLSSSATFTLTVSEVNYAPVPGDDTASVEVGGSVEISVATLLANDTDPEGSTLSVTAVAGAVNGTVTLSDDESKVTYTHDGSETTSGSFTYTVTDGAATGTGTVTIAVTPLNNAPVPVDDTATVAEGDEVEISAESLLSNDTDADDDSLSLSAVGGAVNGTVAQSEDGSDVTYTHDGSETTSGSFTYTVSDGQDSATATVTVTVTPVNDAPTGVNDAASVAEGGEVDISVTTLLANDTDSEGDSVTFAGLGSAVNGTVALSEDGSEVTYTHDGSETTTGSFTYTVSDGTATGTGTVSVSVTPVNDAPTGVADTVTVAEGGEVEVAVAVLLANDSDPEGGDLGITAVSGATNGTAALSEDESKVTYAHDGSETTSGSFTYTVSDGAATATGTVAVTVTPVNDPPGALTLTDQTATVGTSFSYQVPEVTDPDGDDLTYAAFLGTGSNPLPDWLSLDAETRTISGTPRKAHVGEYEIQVTVTDSIAASKKAEFTLTVQLPPNRPPVAPDLTAQSATEDQAFSYEIPEFDDPDEDTVAYAAALGDGGALPGWLSLNATSRELGGTPLEADTPASYSIRITATDDGSPSKSSAATFTLTVVEVNDAPLTPSLTDQTALVSQPFSYTFTAVTDPEGGDVTYAASVGESGELPSWLSFDAESLTLGGTPEESDALAAFAIRITATDDADPPLASSADFTLTVSRQNGAPQAVDDTAIVAEGDAVTIPSSDLLANDSDPDEQALVITSVGDAVYGTATLAADAASVTYRHDGSEGASGTFTYTVSDGAATDTATVAITVTPVNDPPSTPSVADQTAVEDEHFSYRFSAVTDPESDGVTYTSALGGGGSLPSWLGFDAETRDFSGTPREADTPATLTIAVTAADDGEPAESVAATFTLTVAEVNDPPAAPQVSDRTALVGVEFTYAVPAAYDSENWPLTYAAAQGLGFNPLPRWLQFDEGTRTFSGTPLKADVAEYVIVVSVSDELHTTWASFTLTVEIAANRPPVPPQITTQEASEDLPFAFVVPPFADPDENLVEYAAGVVSLDGTVAGLPAWLTFESSSRILSGTPREGDTPDVLTIVVTATDDGDPPASAEVGFTLNVGEVNDPPTASAGKDQTAPAASVVTLDGSGSIDPEGESLIYAWSQEGETPVAISGADTSAPTFAAPAQLPADVELVFTLVVTDVAGAESEPDSVSIRVVGSDSPAQSVVPVISIEAEIASVVEGQVASFRIEAEPSPDRPIAIVMDVTGGYAYGVADGQRDVFILPGDTSSILVLHTVDDQSDEPHGRISATIRRQPLYTVGVISTAQVVVSDNDSPSQPAPEITPEPTLPPSPTAAPTPEPTLPPSPTAAFTPKPTLPPSPTTAPTPQLTLPPSPTASLTPEPASPPSPAASLTPETTSAGPPTAVPTPEPTIPGSLSRTPAPGPATIQPVGQPQATTSAWPTATAPVSPALSIQPPPVPTPTEEAEEPPATATPAPAGDDEGADRMGWIVTIVLAGVTAATGGTVLLQGARQ